MRVSEGETEQTLARRAREGDPDAFGALVERYKRHAFAHALAIVGSREDALDLSQEAFVRAYRARHTLDPTRSFGAWLYQIVRRVCLNFLRDSKTRARLLEAQGGWLIERAQHAQIDPSESAERADTRRRISAAIERLPPHEREVLVLKEFEELKYREIAERLEVPIGTVMSRLYSARKRLAETLEERR